MNKLKLAYFGTPYFAADFLEKIISDLNDKIDIKIVVTQSDAKVGRKQKLTSTPVKKCAQKYSLPLFDENISDKNSLQKLIGIMRNEKIDLALLFAYGKLIPDDLLNAPVRGFWNIHPSLLPKFRGASPMVYPLLLDEKVTGVTLMQMDPEMDHGPIITQSEYEIKKTDTRTDLERELGALGFKLFADQVIKEKIDPQEQRHGQGTYTRLLKKNDGYFTFEFLQKALANQTVIFPDLPDIIKDFFERNKIDRPSFEHNASDIILRLYRALIGWPGVWTYVKVNGEQKRLKITEINVASKTLEITKVQLEGKNEVSFAQFIAAYKVL